VVRHSSECLGDRYFQVGPPGQLKRWAAFANRKEAPYEHKQIVLPTEGPPFLWSCFPGRDNNRCGHQFIRGAYVIVVGRGRIPANQTDRVHNVLSRLVLDCAGSTNESATRDHQLEYWRVKHLTWSAHQS
jgi:hypothetical protein